LTSSGDAPGMNPALRAAARVGAEIGLDMVGVEEGTDAQTNAFSGGPSYLDTIVDGDAPAAQAPSGAKSTSTSFSERTDEAAP